MLLSFPGGSTIVYHISFLTLSFDNLREITKFPQQNIELGLQFCTGTVSEQQLAELLSSSSVECLLLTPKVPGSRKSILLQIVRASGVSWQKGELDFCIDRKLCTCVMCHSSHRSYLCTRGLVFPHGTYQLLYKVW